MKPICRSQKGQVFILFAVTLFVLIGFTGLAIDLGMAYTVQTKLSAALDSAAVAAGKTISQGAAAAQSAATSFFKANLPDGLLGASVSAPSVSAIHNADGSWTVSATGQASSPTYFAKVFGVNSITVSSSATSTVRTLDLILVLDTSGSLNTPSSTPALLKAAATDFINNNFDTSSDRVGLVHFSSGAVTDVPITSAKGFSQAGISSAINAISVHGATTSEEALRIARALLDGVPADSQSSLRAIVFFTDGAPNGVAGTFNNGGRSVTGDLYSETDPGGAPYRMFNKGQQDTQLADANSIATLPTADWTNTVNLASYDSIRPAFTYTNTRCNVNMAARNMLENVANAARSEGNPIHIFTIGLGADLTSLEINFCGYGSSELGENILKRLANIQGADTYNSSQPTGLYAYAADASQLQAAFNQIASSILRISK